MKKNITLQKAQYIVGDDIKITVLLDVTPSTQPNIKLYQLARLIEFDMTYHTKDIPTGGVELVVEITSLPIGNYGVEVCLDEEIYSTAFDVVESNRVCTRYGFLSDFSSNENDVEDIEYLNRLHINAIQFYDWMYKHEDLISEKNLYTDPLGRLTDLSVIKTKIQHCIQLGIRPFAYGAVYAASKDFFKDHPEWGLYTVNQQPITFFDWLHFMNISKDCGWSDIIIKEFTEAMKQLQFQGIHMDTYGFPKIVCDANQKSFSLADEFPDLINRADKAARTVDPKNGVIFNCVNNWPVEQVAKTNQDAIYIEVWPPHDTYYDLYQLIQNAKRMSGKQVVLAAYMHPFAIAEENHEIQTAENSLLLTNAVISVSGGTQLVFGENGGILCDSYYAKYAKASPTFQDKIVDYSDFLVRYADLLYLDEGIDVSMTSASGINEDIIFISDTATFSSKAEAYKVWTVIRESSKRMTINLVNLTTNESEWNEPKNAIDPICDIIIKVNTNRKVNGVYCASPDHSLSALSLSYDTMQTDRGIEYTIHVPSLLIWTSVWIETE